MAHFLITNKIQSRKWHIEAEDLTAAIEAIETALTPIYHQVTHEIVQPDLVAKIHYGKTEFKLKVERLSEFGKE